MKNNKIWDIYIRVFHWLLAPSIVIAIISGINSELEIHLFFAKIILFLLVFRTIWGFIGYKTARFFYFIKSPKVIFQYIKTGKTNIVGHNPLGAISVAVMLDSISLQLLSGLFTTDEVLFEAPFYEFSGEYQELLQNFHTTFFIILILLIILHISAIIFYKIKGKNLVKDMFDGGKTKQVFTIKYMHLKAFMSAIFSALSVYLIFY
jgi:cytochrome b